MSKIIPKICVDCGESIKGGILCGECASLRKVELEEHPERFYGMIPSKKKRKVWFEESPNRKRVNNGD